jgi:hypothetical protein
VIRAVVRDDARAKGEEDAVTIGGRLDVHPPLARLQELGFSSSPEWLERVRLSSLRFNDGGSGAFVSKDGLMATNHHVALECLQNLSTRDKDVVATGFTAPGRDQEPACPGYEVSVLLKTEEVTDRVLQTVTQAMSDKEASLARKAAIARLRNACSSASGLRCDMVSLYQGGEYYLYSYKTYTDVRLVFAPEQEIAFFGGDPDNFNFPRYDLDIALFRVYENNAPVASADYLKWSDKGAADGELVFVSGHPGSTDRLDTAAQLETERDVVYPTSIGVVTRRLEALRKYASLGGEQTRQAANITFSLENALKAYHGELQGLNDVSLFEKKRTEEREFRARIEGNPDPKHISTSYVERQNLTMRMSMRRFTRLTNGFSKKVENHEHAIALYFMYYNFARIHQTLRVTPAMEAGIASRVWDLSDLIAA